MIAAWRARRARARRIRAIRRAMYRAAALRVLDRRVTGAAVQRRRPADPYRGSLRLAGRCRPAGAVADA
ncbi:hypothetical protein GCM10009635_54410 [Actinocatenispora thailandica]